jgi:hypothetical protein
MTRDDIIRTAREAGWDMEWGGTTIEQVAAFAALVAAAEREACAKVCEAEAEKWEGDDGPICAEARMCAVAIRARGDA